jgi:hypothetical protein
MLSDDAISTLRYKSEGVDLDFKSEQYRFEQASDRDKAELLKDVLAMANAWRDGDAHILLGFIDRKPHPAETIGIAEHLDDAKLQKFVNSKVKPKLAFRYEEGIYDGKPIAIITIPKQPRPFFLEKAYDKLKPKVVYVRRGSSTDEADPSEIAKMGHTDAGSGSASIDLRFLDSHDEPLPDAVDLRLLSFSEIPDYASRQFSDPYGFAMASMWQDNRDYHRDCAEYLANYYSVIDTNLEVTNRSGFSLSDAKLEISVESLEGQAIRLATGSEYPDLPVKRWNQLDSINRFSNVVPVGASRFYLEQRGKRSLCHAIIGTLLPDETAKPEDWLAIYPAASGRIRIAIRLLARELKKPMEFSKHVTVTATMESHELDGLQKIWKQYQDIRKETDGKLL